MSPHGSVELTPPAANLGRPFAAVRLRGKTWVVKFTAGCWVHVGSAETAEVRIDDPEIPLRCASLRWDGRALRLRSDPPPVRTFCNGREVEEETEIQPGDEIAVGPARVVVGVAPALCPDRRVLTHEEFRERLSADLARSSRVGRPASLAMIRTASGEGGRVAVALLRLLRAGDQLGTYAPDEVELLLPDTDASTAQLVLERLIDELDGSLHAGLGVSPVDGDSLDGLMRAVRGALTHAERTRRAVARPPRRTKSEALPVVEDPVTKDLVARLHVVAGSEVPVLLTGERSSGKSAFARLIHEHSAHRADRFITVSCAALAGGIEEALPALAADRGATVLLDEIGELALKEQSAVLAWLAQAGPRVRPIATTHRALAGLAERGAFAQELFDLFAASSFEVPPLRSRPEDILSLASFFARQAGARASVRFSLGAVARLRSYPWPGNVLELANAMERAVRLSGGGEILAEHLPTDVLSQAGSEGRLRRHVDALERDAIAKALADHNHNQTHAAKRLGLSRRALIYKMEKYGLKPPPRAARQLRLQP